MRSIRYLQFILCIVLILQNPEDFQYTDIEKIVRKKENIPISTGGISSKSLEISIWEAFQKGTTTQSKFPEAKHCSLPRQGCCLIYRFVQSLRDRTWYSRFSLNTKENVFCNLDRLEIISPKWKQCWKIASLDKNTIDDRRKRKWNWRVWQRQLFALNISM